MRPLKHLTPRYVYDRCSLMAWQRLNPEAPWLTRTAIDFIGEWLSPSDTVFEWGSGRSTAWFARQVTRVISVEHDPVWYERVAGQLGDSSGVERHLAKTSDDIKDESSERYVAVIGTLPDDAIDLVLVDGLHRDECALRAVEKVRPGGLLVLDNADWYFATGSHSPASKWKKKLWSDTWGRFETAVAGWRRIVTTNGVWDTVIWIKPSP
jgi:predicted O-methyltransferase YrrM